MPVKQTLYCIPGLGANRQVFHRLRVKDHTIKVLHWPAQIPENLSSLAEVARLFLSQIDERNSFSLLGFSLGGLIALELSVVVKPQHCILISSISKPGEIRFFHRVLMKARVHLLIKRLLLREKDLPLAWLFGTNNPTAKRLINNLLQYSSPQHIAKVISLINTWKGAKVNDVNILTIQGGQDFIIKGGRSKADLWLPDAGHLLLLSHAKQLNAFLNERLIRIGYNH